MGGAAFFQVPEANTLLPLMPDPVMVFTILPVVRSMVTGKVQSVLRDSMEIETGVMIALSYLSTTPAFTCVLVTDC